MGTTGEEHCKHREQSVQRPQEGAGVARARGCSRSLPQRGQVDHVCM